jgi:methylated-DNA-[protein]-cysteine S-methyltransferase
MTSRTQRFVLERLATPLGEALMVVDERQQLRALDWDDHAGRMQRLLHIHYGADVTLLPGRGPREIRACLQAYFGGEVDALNALQVATHGSVFQKAVWAELRRVPAGQTVSYGELARQLGRPNACRAVGLANGANPISLVVPCHRVVGADGSLTGYAGGLLRKRWLLAHEQAKNVAVRAVDDRRVLPAH